MKARRQSDEERCERLLNCPTLRGASGTLGARRGCGIAQGPPSLSFVWWLDRSSAHGVNLERYRFDEPSICIYIATNPTGHTRPQ